MNIFYVDEIPEVAAISLVDRHVVKMILESCQLLSTAHRVCDGKDNILMDEREYILYKATHKNHPSAIWVRQSVSNYNWLVEHTYGLCAEYTHRYGKVHKSQSLMLYLQSPPYNVKDYDFTSIPCCMGDEYIISDNPVINYRNYYKKGKSDLHKWTKRNPPDWILEKE